MFSRKTDNPEIMRHYKKYYKVLTGYKVSKKSYYSKLMLNSKSRIKISWDNIKAVTNTNCHNNSIPPINIEGKLCNNVQIIANTINNYFSAPLLLIQSTIFSNPLHS
jgi:hypothetical protein